MGLANRVVAPGQTREAAEELARQIASFPPTTMRGDRLSSYEQWGLSLDDALAREFEHGMRGLQADAVAGAQRFAGGAGRHGSFEN